MRVKDAFGSIPRIKNMRVKDACMKFNTKCILLLSKVILIGIRVTLNWKCADGSN